MPNASSLRCDLCPKACRLRPGERGDCRIRVNLDGRLTALTYGHPCSTHIDPIEKKPLFHMLPGSRIFSIATAGCNLHCKHCQNWEISQADPEDVPAHELSPEATIALAREAGTPSVAYTYTEPAVYYEYTRDCARLARAAGLRNVLVTAAYINRAPWLELCRDIDAANIDLKAFSDSFYREVCGGTLQPVLNALVAAREAGIFIEITNLLIPTLNDTDAMVTDLCRWVVNELGAETPLHFSGFFPQYRMTRLPPTPPETLARARAIAQAEGLAHVYAGNVRLAGAQNTHCAGCRALLIERSGFSILANHLVDGACPECTRALAGIWQ